MEKAQNAFRAINDEKPPKELLDLAVNLIDSRTAPFDASSFHDRYVDALKRLIDKKQKAKGKKILEDTAPVEARSGNVIDLMAALKQSVRGEDDAPRAAPAAKKDKPAARRKRAGGS